MEAIFRGKRNKILVAVLTFLTAAVLISCKGKTEEKVQDLDFTVVAENEIPQELKEIIEQKKKEMFRLTFTSGEDLYIAAGYGEQKTGGFSISVPELYLTENSIRVKTELMGPKKGEEAGQEPSFPYIVIKTAFMEEPVVFQ